ncbi:ead/Ea22-like family protein [Methylocaldum szegediense]|uniref:ead/Ea22-like family protein n=1 Tax=Methylocaldum szegediense TaxID=73780 RepID=UPI00040AC9B5|nr:ead/Ea22-like family protein [Methylocaldum szegediense]
MTDRYQEIRDALAMEPTPGSRRVIDGDSYPYVTVALPENEGRRWDDPIICTLYEDVTPDDYVGFGERLQTFPNARANAALIAACDPDTIRALLEERDAQQAEIETLRAEVKRLHADLMESDEIREKLSHLLTRTAAALKGEPPDGVWHSWHDLPERATQLKEALEEVLSRSTMNLAMNPNPYALTALLGDIYQIADAALAKEDE